MSILRLLLVLMLLFWFSLVEAQDDEMTTCLLCEADQDCDDGGACVDGQCTNEFGFFGDGCRCYSDLDCISGECDHLCMRDDGTACTEDSNCLDSDCTLEDVCVPALSPAEGSGEPPQSSGLGWIEITMITTGAGSFLFFIFVICACRNVRESGYDCCCATLSTVCLVCDM